MANAMSDSQDVVPTPLERELEAFKRELQRLLTNPENKGKVVLICGDAVDSIWPTVDEALNAGYDKFGLKPFLVKEIVEHEKPLYFSRNLKRCP